MNLRTIRILVQTHFKKNKKRYAKIGKSFNSLADSVNNYDIISGRKRK